MTSVPPPQPSINGGLYTGEPFLPGAPWGNVPVTPDSGFMIHYNLRSANPPPGAIYQYPGGSFRPGNNTPVMPGITKLANKPYTMYCINDNENEVISLNQNKNNSNKFGKYFYL